MSSWCCCTCNESSSSSTIICLISLVIVMLVRHYYYFVSNSFLPLFGSSLTTQRQMMEESSSCVGAGGTRGFWKVVLGNLSFSAPASRRRLLRVPIGICEQHARERHNVVGLSVCHGFRECDWTTSVEASKTPASGVQENKHTTTE